MARLLRITLAIMAVLVLSAPTPPPYRVYVPLAIAPLQYKGLALADPLHPGDIDTLGASWWYDWTATGQTPMLWSGNPSTLIPQNYTGYILVLNEPNVATQANVTPTEAVKRLAILRAYYPDARLVCCGASVWAYGWMSAFWQAGGRPDAWHVHAYTEAYITPTYVATELTRMHDMTGGDYWITEYGSPAGSLADFETVTRWFWSQPWITRVAAYTNRQPEGVPWAIGEGVEMVGPDGSLSPIGDWYAAYPWPGGE